MRKYLQIILLLLVYVFSSSTYAQIGSVIGPNPSAEKEVVYIDRRILKKKTVESNVSVLNDLAHKITRNSTTDNEKAEAIFLWISTNIDYDNELRNNVKLQKQFYISEEKVIAKVLERRKALCGGYAFLFQGLCKQVGIEAEAIDGFSQNYSGNIKSNKQPNHSWNAVKLNERWYLLDITMAVSHGSYNNPDSYWFKTDPIFFIKTHYPENLRWALIRNPISRNEFDSLP